jgi:anti-sigma B factor antagonist
VAGRVAALRGDGRRAANVWTLNGGTRSLVLFCAPIMSKLDRYDHAADYVRSQRGDMIVLAIRGNLVAENSDSLRAEVTAIEESHEKKVLVDLQGLEYIDSSGVGVLMSLFKRVGKAGGQVCFAGVKEQPEAVLKALRFDKLFDVCDSFEDALKKLAGT